MANSVALSTLGGGFGPLNQGGLKAVVVSFSNVATADVLIFDTSNVGKENALSKIVWALCVTATGFGASTVIASNQLTVNNMNAAGAGTTVTAFAIGVGA